MRRKKSFGLTLSCWRFVFSVAVFVLIIAPNTSANTAQPGLWNAGGTATFSLLFPEDSAHFKKIQMVKELVTIKLYDGFAVVKGSYWMYNSTSEMVTFKTGYPVNSMFRAEKNHNRMDVVFDDLYQLKVLTNGVPTNLIKEPISQPDFSDASDNWYVWVNQFSAMDTTLIQVYFIVKTSNARLREGYATEGLNGFVYLLESGSTWKQPIVKGRIQIQLAENIEIGDVRGIRPDSIFKWNQKHRLFVTDFENLSPNANDNIVITYKQHQKDFAFENVVKEVEKYFGIVDDIEALSTVPSDFTMVSLGDPFETKSWSINPYLFVIIGPLILMVLLIAIIILVFQRIRRRKIKQ